MRIAIIGAGIAGVTCAYELAADGHRVCVFERRGSVAAESSFANAGLVAPGLALPWAAPRLSLGADMGWRWRRWRAARDKTAGEAQDRLLLLALYSRERLLHLRRGLQLDFEQAEGQLVLLRSARELAAIQAGLERLQRLGIVAKQLDAEQCRAIEPGLSTETALHGGIQLSQASVGNCRQFAHQLRLEAQKLGAQFRFHTTVRSILPGKPVRLTHEYRLPTEHTGPASRLADAGDTVPMPQDPQQDDFDAVIVCAGLARPNHCGM